MKKASGKNKLWADLGLIGLLLIVAGVLYLVFVLGSGSGQWAIVCVDGEEIARYSLLEEGSFPVNGGTNILHIEGGRACLTDANCPDKLCVKQGWIEYTGQRITCLPNHLTVSLEGVEEGMELVS